MGYTFIINLIKKMEKTIYSFWGKRPFFYKLACVITFLGREKLLRKKAAGNLQLKEGDKVLDLACGTGLNFEYLQEYVGPKGRIIGFDYSKDMLSAARKRAEENNWKNVKLVQGDAAKLALDYKVDGVISTLGISAIPNHKEALKRAVNALKKGGRIVILDAKPFGGILAALNPLVKLIYMRFANWDYRKDIISDLKKIVGKVNIMEYNLGTIYILTGIKQRGGERIL